MARTHKYLEGIQAREAYFRGADKVAKIVTESIGPFGLNLATEKGKKTTNDGKLISQSVSVAIEDEFERAGALLQDEICAKTNEEVADATSTTIALSKGIRRELVKYLPTTTRFVSTMSVEQLSQKLNKEREEVVNLLKEGVKTIESREDLIASAMVSVENQELAELIGGTQWDLGPDGRIIPEEVNENGCSVELVDGIMIDNGFATSLAVNNPAENTLELSDGKILHTNYTIGKEEFPKLAVLIQEIAKSGDNKLVVIARAFTQEVIAALNGLAQTGFAVYPINAPYVDQAQIMLDIESVVGGRYIDQDLGTFDELRLEDLGEFTKIKMRLMGGIITGKNSDKKQARIERLREELKGNHSVFTKRKIEERIAALNSKLALLKIGAYVKQDRERLKDKADDAVVSVRMALRGGTVKGGGLAFKEISDKLETDSLLKRPLTVVYDQIMSSAPEGFVIEDWVRDPFLTLETALRNACEGSISMCRVNGAVVQRDIKSKDTEYEND